MLDTDFLKVEEDRDGTYYISAWRYVGEDVERIEFIGGYETVDDALRVANTLNLPVEVDA